MEVNKTNARHGCFANELKNVTRETFRTGNIFGPARANEVIAILDALTVQPTKDFRQNIIIPNPALLEEQALKPAWSMWRAHRYGNCGRHGCARANIH